MKKIAIVFLLFFYGIILKAENPIGINARFGDSQLKGLFGLELEVWKASISAGWRPACIPYGPNFHSFSTSLTFYNKQWGTSSWYGSLGYVTKGYIWYEDYVYTSTIFTGGYKAEPSVIAMVGRRINFRDISPNLTNRISIDTGLGLFVSGHGTGLSFELLFNYALIRNANTYKYRYRDDF